MYNLIVMFLSIIIILLLIIRARNRSNTIFMETLSDNVIFDDRPAINTTLPWTYKYQPPIKVGDSITYKSDKTIGERYLTILSSMCGIGALVLEIIDRVKG